MRCRQCGCGEVLTDPWINDWFVFCSASCAVQWSLDRPLDDPAWNKVKVGVELTSIGQMIASVDVSFVPLVVEAQP